MKILQKQYVKDKEQAGASPDGTLRDSAPLSLSDVAALVRACFQVSDQTEQRRDRGDGDERSSH